MPTSDNGCAICGRPKDDELHEGSAITENLHLYEPPESGLEKGEYFVALAANRTGFPTRYGNCNCQCHVSPVNHFAPCCTPDWTTHPIRPKDPQYLHTWGVAEDVKWEINPYTPIPKYPEDDLTPEEAVDILVEWIDLYREQETPHVRDILAYNYIIATLRDFKKKIDDKFHADEPDLDTY